MTTNTPDNLELTPEALAALEAQIAGLTAPTALTALDAALAPATPRAGLADEAALLTDLRLASLLDAALAAEAPAGLEDRIVAQVPLREAPLHEVPVAGRIGAKPATAGNAGSWMRKPWRYAAVASISFSLSLMAVSFIAHKEAAMIRSWSGGNAEVATSDLDRLQQVVGLDAEHAGDGLELELAETRAEMELAGL